MAVLCEGISVVVRSDAIEEKFPGDWPAFRDLAGHLGLCSDSELARVGFLTPDDVGAFVGLLESHGLVHLRDGAAVDMVVVDQQFGPTSRCDWAWCGTAQVGPRPQDVAMLCGMHETHVPGQFFHPEGWTWEGSLSQHFGFVPNQEIGRSMDFLRREGDRDIYVNRHTGERFVVQRRSAREEHSP